MCQLQVNQLVCRRLIDQRVCHWYLGLQLRFQGSGFGFGLLRLFSLLVTVWSFLPQDTHGLRGQLGSVFGSSFVVVSFAALLVVLSG